MIKNSLFIFIFLALSFFSCAKNSKDLTFQSEGVQFKLLPVVTGLDIPWSFTFLPGGDLLITEKDGRILWHKKSTPSDQTQEVQNVPEVIDRGQGGLMDIVLHPDFKKTPWIYLTYSITTSKGQTTRVSRALWDNGKLKNLEIIFTALPYFKTNIHFGSRLIFDGKGHIFFTVGDRRNRDQAQSLKTHNGKVMRLYEDGKIPPDNPFFEKGLLKKSKSPIWSYGHRNAQGLVFFNNQLWLHEHGPRGGDEINLVLKGRNYGWPVITYGKEYIGGRIGEGTEREDIESPKKYYIPSIAPSGMAYYNGDEFPSWKGSFFIGSLVLTHLNRVSFSPQKEERLLKSFRKRIRDVRVFNGSIYISAEGEGIFKITK